MSTCHQEMCRNWGGDGEVCTCSLFDLTREIVKECDTCGEDFVTDDPAILRHEGCDW